MTEFFTSPQHSTLQASFRMSGKIVRTAQMITFTATANGGTPPYFYNWNFGDGNKGTGSSIVHAYQAAGNFITTLTVTDTVGATATFSQTVTVASSGAESPFVPIPILYLAIGGITVGLLVAALVAVKRRRPRKRNLNSRRSRLSSA